MVYCANRPKPAIVVAGSSVVEDKAQFINRLEHLLVDRGISSHAELARKANINVNTIAGYWKSPYRYPRGDHLVQIARALDTTAEYLITGKESEKPIRDPLIQEVVEKLHAVTSDERQQILALVRAYSEKFLKA